MFKGGFGYHVVPLPDSLCRHRQDLVLQAVSPVREQESVASSAAVTCRVAGTQFARPWARCAGTCSAQVFVTLLHCLLGPALSLLRQNKSSLRAGSVDTSVSSTGKCQGCVHKINSCSQEARRHFHLPFIGLRRKSKGIHCLLLCRGNKVT